MRFFLTGFMGCGKSFWGQRLSARYNLKFIDLDKQIEMNEHQSISHLFELHGEAYFRQLEHDSLLQSIQEHPDFIMATGGGTACFQDNMQWMNQAGKTIYLKASVNYLFLRLRHELSHRPLIAGLSDEALFTWIEKKLAERENMYASSTVIIDVEKADETIFDAIIQNYV